MTQCRPLTGIVGRRVNDPQRRHVHGQPAGASSHPWLSQTSGEAISKGFAAAPDPSRRAIARARHQTGATVVPERRSGCAPTPVPEIRFRDDVCCPALHGWRENKQNKKTIYIYIYIHVDR